MAETIVDLHTHLRIAARLTIIAALLNPILGIVALLTTLVLKAEEIVTPMTNAIMDSFVAKTLVDLDIA